MTKRDPWFKFYPQAWLDGTRYLTLEQRAVYMDCICLIMLEDKPIDREDRWYAHQMHISTRKWKALKPLLIQSQKLLQTEHGLDNQRCQEVRVERQEMRTRNKKIAIERESKRHGSSLVRSRVNAEPMVSSGGKVVEFLKKANKNNDGDTRTVAPEQHHIRVRDRDRRVKRDSESSDSFNSKQIGCANAIPFAQFWEAYPRKQGKAKAREKWKQFGNNERQKAIDAIPHYVKKCQEDDCPLKHGVTYVNQRVWEDYDEEIKPWWEDLTEPLSMERALALLEKYPPNGCWPKELGPIVGTPESPFTPLMEELGLEQYAMEVVPW